MTVLASSLDVGSAEYQARRLTLLDRLPPPRPAAEAGSLIAPMPGNVTRLAAAPGDRVAAGQPVLVIEAMKMEHTITAPAAGILAELRFGPGEQVNGATCSRSWLPTRQRRPEERMTDADLSVLVRAESAGRVRTITLDSPHNANALSTGLLTQLRAALDAAMSDQGVRVVVLTGAGKVFCAGADLKEARTSPAGAPGLMTGVIELLWASSKPIICRVNGAARAGGIGLVAACDIAVAADRASFAFSEVRIGVVPAVISVPCLRRMPSRAAAEYFLTGAVFDAQRAAEIGLVTSAVAAADLDAEVARYAAMLLRGGPDALAGTKGVLRDVPAEGFASGLARMSELSGRYFGSPEAREGMAAFAARRDPSWVEPATPAADASGG